MVINERWIVVYERRMSVAKTETGLLPSSLANLRE